MIRREEVFLRLICIDNTGAALTVGREYEAKRDVNWFYVRVTDDEGRKKTFLEQRFRPVRVQRAAI